MKVGGGIQAILGGKADIYSQEINDIMTHPNMQLAPKTEDTNKNKSETDTKHVAQTVDLASPVNGKFTDLSEVHDDVFSQKMMGEGFAVQPTDGEIYSPVNGTIMSIFKTKHAIGIKTPSGLEVMLHMGLDTVELNGAPFTIHVKEGDKITTDTHLATVDLDQIKDAGKDPVILTLITNTKDYVDKTNNLVQSGEQIKVHAQVFEVLTK